VYILTVLRQFVAERATLATALGAMSQSVTKKHRQAGPEDSVKKAMGRDPAPKSGLTAEFMATHGLTHTAGALRCPHTFSDKMAITAITFDVPPYITSHDRATCTILSEYELSSLRAGPPSLWVAWVG
jgi:hypothetical protein